MRWRLAAVGVLALMMAGCPSGFGKEGRVAKAVHQDALGIVRKICSEKEHWEVCNGPNKDPERCRECGG
jgi:hypothetical protein